MAETYERDLCVCYIHSILIPNCCTSQVDALVAHVEKLVSSLKMAKSEGRNMWEQLLTNKNFVQQVGIKYDVFTLVARKG